jgi:hypothetical protein
MGSDARLHPRFALAVRADVVGDEVVLGRPVADISLGGCRFDGRGWEGAGAKVELVLAFAGNPTSLSVRGIVVRTSERDMGVRFVDQNDEQKWALRKLLREAQRRPS